MFRGKAAGPAGQQAQREPSTEGAPIGPSGLFDLGRLRDSRRRDENLGAIGSLCHNAYLGDFTSLCRVLGRFNVLVDTRDRALAAHLLMRGHWELHVSECLARCLKPGMRFVDAGANYGYFTLLACGLVGPQGDALAVEANPAMADLLEASLGMNGMRARSRVRRVALAERSGTTLPFLVHVHRGNSRLLLPGEDGAALASDGHRLLEVPLETLDAQFPRGTRVDVMKVDIEGAELPFWAGARRVLTENPEIQVLMEVKGSRYADPAGYFEALRADGFVLRVLTKAGRIEDTSVEALVGGELCMLYLSRRASLPRRFALGHGS